MKNQQINVEYACTPSGKHDAPIQDCVSKKIKTFSNRLAAAAFISACSYVYNLDEALEALPTEALPEISEQVKELENFDVSALV